LHKRTFSDWIVLIIQAWFGFGLIYLIVISNGFDIGQYTEPRNDSTVITTYILDRKGASARMVWQRQVQVPKQFESRIKEQEMKLAIEVKNNN